MNNEADVIRSLQFLFQDRNMRFPARPKLVSDLNVFQMPDGLGVQFRGGESMVMVWGRQADAALAHLIKTLDGSRTVEQLLEHCPPEVDRAGMLQTLWLLHTKGLLAKGEAAASPEEGEPEDEVLRRQMLFWGRHLDVTRNAPTARAVQNRLGNSSLLLLGTGLFGAATYDLLTRSGCRDVRVLDWDDDGLFIETVRGRGLTADKAGHLTTTSVDEVDAWLRTWVDGVDMLVTATRNAPRELFGLINRVCLDHNRQWLRGNIEATQIEVGPYVRPYGSACYTCLELRLVSAQELAIEEQLYQQSLAELREAGTTPPLGEALFAATLGAGLLSGEVIRILTSVAVPTLLNTQLTYVPLSGSMQANQILRVPRCPDCYRGTIRPPAGEPAETARVGGGGGQEVAGAGPEVAAAGGVTAGDKAR